MNTTDLVQFPTMNARRREAPRRPTPAPARYELLERVRSSILRARHFLCAEQRVDGSWAGATTGEIVPLCQLVLLLAFLEREQESLAEQAARAILRQQLAEGGWAAMPGGDFDLDVSVLAYFALKVVGEDGCRLEMASARRAIRARGGADRCGDATRRWLALLGQIDYELCAPVMPEWLLASSLNRDATSRELLGLAAQSVVWSRRPRRELELSRGVRELFIESPRNWATAQRKPSQVAGRFNRLWSRCERAGLAPFRRRALERASFFLTESAIESPLMELSFEELAWQWIAIKALGFQDSSRAIQSCERRFHDLIAVDEAQDEARSQATTTLSADTSLALAALSATGLSNEHATVAAGVRWIIEHRLPIALASVQVAETEQLLRAFTMVASATATASDCFPPALGVLSGWEAMEPGSETTQTASLAKLQSLIDRLVSGLSTAQRADGGWSVGPVGRQRASGIQHAMDHRAGASAPELTGAVLESISSADVCVRAISERAIVHLKSTQHGDGRWNSVTNARYIYGTSCAVRGLLAAGMSATDPIVGRGVNWLLVHQGASGGWGEASGGAEQEFVDSDASAIQTAWAVLALAAAGMADHEATRRGIDFLVESQSGLGGWCDSALVERDTAEGPWYQNQLHSTSWSLLALATWARSISEEGDEPAAALRLVCGDSIC